MMNQIPNNSAGKVKTGSTIRTETKTTADNGITETIVTRIITDHYADGSSNTRREMQSTREEEEVNGYGGAQRSMPVQNTPQFVVQTQPYQGQGQGQPQYQPVAPPPQRFGSGSMPSQQQSYVPQGRSYDEVSLGQGSSSGQFQQPSVRTPDDIFVEEAQRCHNKYRAKHNVPPVTVSKDLCKAAQNWADQLAARGNMENSHFGYGENIYWSSGPGHAMKGDVPVEYWYHEEAHFDWGRMDFQKSTGSFTQLIWKDSKQFGIAKATGAKGTFVVAFYIPPGNVLSKFHENVFHPLSPGPR